MAPVNWYYKILGEEHGPVTSQDLRRMAMEGTLNPDDLVRKEEMNDWVAASRLKGIEFANSQFDPYDEEFDPEAETYDSAEYARSTRKRSPKRNRDVVYAGFWLRFAAFFIDWIILIVISAFIGAIYGFVLAILGVDLDVIQKTANLIGVLVSWIYYAASESSSAQATLGKRALGIKVTDLNGRRISFLRALGRTVAKILSGMILLIGYIMAGFTEKKQALHDMIASCVVVKN
ncbi:MAG: hypothetical protein CMJ46_07525 [Planctomyces sp.]|nr:hypothetical protein [Planctomyces sp.]